MILMTAKAIGSDIPSTDTASGSDAVDGSSTGT
jgi:hypothetical protein